VRPGEPGHGWYLLEMRPKHTWYWQLSGQPGYILGGIACRCWRKIEIEAQVNRIRESEEHTTVNSTSSSPGMDLGPCLRVSGPNKANMFAGIILGILSAGAGICVGVLVVREFTRLG